MRRCPRGHGGPVIPGALSAWQSWRQEVPATGHCGEYGGGMADPVRVMLEQGKKKRVVACAFDWPG
ncbi:MAG: hypothetical protein ACYDGN_09245 [Acidimicrobiales bacterium]